MPAVKPNENTFFSFVEVEMVGLAVGGKDFRVAEVQIASSAL